MESGRFTFTADTFSFQISEKCCQWIMGGDPAGTVLLPMPVRLITGGLCAGPGSRAACARLMLLSACPGEEEGCVAGQEGGPGG